MGFAKAVGTILRETFAAPVSGSYVIHTPRDTVVIRQGGTYANLDLSGSNLSGLDLRATNLPGANLRNADLRGTNLSGADLTDADLTGALVSSAKFDDAKLPDASMSHLVFDLPPSGLAPGTTQG